MSKLAIVVIAYNRLDSLKRLIGSLLNADYLGDIVDLFISLDNSGIDTLENFAESIIWPYGEKKIISHEERLGLKRHVLKCGELTEIYENICVLEDDLYVSPGFYAFSKAAIDHFSDLDEVAGISLYSHQWNPYVNRPFYAMQDGYDIYSMQIASSWGQIWNRNSWRDFVQWMEGKTDQDLKSDNFPGAVSDWSEKSWLKFHNRYLVDQNKYFVYPRCSLTTNFSDPGEHAELTSTYQVPLLVRAKQDYSFPVNIESSTRYDAFFENMDIASSIGVPDQDLDVSFYYNRIATKRFLLTSAIHDKKIVKTFGMRLRPIELNVIYEIPGDDIFLYDMSINSRNTRSRCRYYARRFLYDIKSNSKRHLLISASALYLSAIRKRLFK
ncbi:glycosyltransferase family A protein [Pseudomonas asiatica]|uniref:glycosyltransferase family A protein n=1 Tax=Pseudomonas asiatica TaxID=2219225 RepID=UPI002E7B3EA2|nr:glycosyltransferase family A protein [Pseudomonas asiatica]MEE1917682.1 glycosyltransferase family A protein [Pseudomonas asiatica]